MARKYAGIMALVGMTTVLFRSLRAGYGLESAMISALAWMATLGVVGLIVGAIAQATVDESVRVTVEQQLAGRQQTK